MRPLHDCASYLISLTHSWLERITHLPFPIGTFIRHIEDTVDRWTHPLTHSLECHSLYILSSIDDKIISFVGSCGICAKTKLRMVLPQLYAQKLRGTTGRFWIQYEGVVKEDIRKAVYVANRVPLINLVTPIVLSVLSPSAIAISDWLLKQGERSCVKSLQTVENDLVMLKQEVGNNAKSDMQTSLLIKSDVCSVQSEEQNASSVHINAKERSIRMDDDALVDQTLSAKEREDVAKEGTSEVEVVKEEMRVDEANMDKVGIEKTGSSHVEEGEDGVLDVLEMIESSWLLGTSSFSRNPRHQPQMRNVSNFNLDMKKAFFNG